MYAGEGKGVCFVYVFPDPALRLVPRRSTADEADPQNNSSFAVLVAVMLRGDRQKRQGRLRRTTQPPVSFPRWWRTECCNEW